MLARARPAHPPGSPAIRRARNGDAEPSSVPFKGRLLGRDVDRRRRSSRDLLLECGRTGIRDTGRGERRRGECLADPAGTAGLLIASGAAWLVAGSGAKALVAAGLGMLLYTVIVSPGYFLARHELPVVGMFGVLAALTVTALVVTVT